MLRSRGIKRPQVQPQNQWSWELFCREEARESATAFLERVRRFKSSHATAREVHDSTFTNEFSAAFLEESSLIMSGCDRTLTPVSAANPLTSSLPAICHSESGSSESPDRKGSRLRAVTGGGKWWSGLFEWSKSKRTKEITSNGSSLSGTGGNRQKKKVLKETATVQLLNLNEQENRDVMRWSPCKLVLVEQQDYHYQLEIYAPPKVSLYLATSP